MNGRGRERHSAVVMKGFMRRFRERKGSVLGTIGFQILDELEYEGRQAKFVEF